MSSDHRTAQHLSDIRYNAVRAQAVLRRRSTGEIDDVTANEAIERCLGRLTEAAIRIGPDTWKTLGASVENRTLRGLGNILRHHYDRLRRSDIDATVRDDLPLLYKEASAALSRLVAVPTLTLAMAEAAPTLLHDALADTGFVVVTDHGIDLSRLHDAYTQVEAFFARPEEEKRRYMVGADGQRGYTPFGREHAKDADAPDLKEFWHVGRGEIAPNVWPDEPRGFREQVAWLYDALDALGLRLLRALTEPLGVAPDTFEKMAAGGNSVLRLLHYPPLAPDADPRSVRAAAHEDINLITLLVSASAAGLELKDRSGAWRAVEAPPDSVIVDVGDMLSRITNGRLPATTHRVVNPEGPNTSRYSMPFFLHPRPDALLSVFDQYRDGSEAPDITGGDFLAERLRQIGLS